MVGSSTTSAGNASGLAGSQIVSEICGVFDAGERDDVAGARLFHFDAIQAEEAHHLHDALVAHLALASTTTTGLFGLILPRLMRPMPIAPT